MDTIQLIEAIHKRWAEDGFTCRQVCFTVNEMSRIMDISEKAFKSPRVFDGLRTAKYDFHVDGAYVSYNIFEEVSVVGGVVGFTFSKQYADLTGRYIHWYDDFDFS